MITFMFQARDSDQDGIDDSVDLDDDNDGIPDVDDPDDDNDGIPDLGKICILSNTSLLTCSIAHKTQHLHQYQSCTPRTKKLHEDL